jgi:hypothetical protein
LKSIIDEIREEKMNKTSNTQHDFHSWSEHHGQGLPTEMGHQRGAERTMNESKFTLANGARLFVAMLAVLAALVALQIFGANPAEARCAADADCGTISEPEPSYSPPANDNFSAAKSLSLWSNTTVGGVTTNATLESGEPKPYSATKDCGVLGISKSVWFKVTPDYKGTIKVSTAGSSFDTVVALYKGSSLTSLQQVNCSNDNSSPNWTDNMVAAVDAGQTYYLQLSGTGGARSGTYKLNVGWKCYYASADHVLCPI